MKLLAFAHRNEANEFLVNLDLESIEQGKLYGNDDLLVAILGEGIENALGYCSYLLGKFKIDEVINLGVCGALKDDLNLNQIIDIRTVYRAHNNDLEFKSFSGNGNYDCITSNQRIHDPKQKSHLACFAHIVDRELWAIAFACKQFNIPWSSHKLISDFSNENICDFVSSKGKEYSVMLWSFFKELKDQKLQNIHDDILPEGFYFTESMKRTYKSLYHALKIKYDKHLKDLINFSEFTTIEGHPKKRTIALLEMMKELRSPYNTKVKRKLESLTKPFTTNSIEIVTDSKLESSRVKIILETESQEDLIHKLEFMQKIPISQIQEILEGQDVQ